tara:strand:+ start:2900 stop:3913 length:1014 start_codon:yes stop_codon:yes gene_type:complete
MNIINTIEENKTDDNSIFCCAITKINKRCSFKSKCNGLCSRHNKIGINNIKTIFNTPNYNSSHSQKRKVPFHIEYVKNDLARISKIQAHIRRKIVSINIRDRGIATFARHLLTNDTDIGEFVSIKDSSFITNYNFISYMDETNNYWGFHVASLKELLKHTDINPYSMVKIPQNIIELFNNLITKMEKIKIVEVHQEVITDPKILIQQKCIKIFQLIDELGQYTQCNWFLTLNLVNLKELYKQLEDIWNYRAELSPEDKKRYIKDGKLFTYKIHEINAIKSRNQLANILLDDFEKLVTQGATKSDCQTGALWILSGLTIVSYDARIAMAWLFQSANVY